MRVDFPLPFEYIWVCGRPVALVRCTYRFHVERIGIWIYANAFELPSDHSFDHFLQGRILVYITDVWPYLGARVAKPHGRNVSGVYECVWSSLLIFVVMYGGVKGVGIAVGKHPLQTRILQQSCNSLDVLFNSFRCEKPVLWQRALVGIFLRLFSAVPDLLLSSHLQHQFASGSDIAMSDISFCICFSIEGDALDVAVVSAVALGDDTECSSRNLHLYFVEERRTEPVAVCSRLHLIESE